MPPKFVRKPDSIDYASSGASERMNLLQDHSDEEDFFLNGPNTRPGHLVNKKDNKVARYAVVLTLTRPSEGKPKMVCRMRLKTVVPCT
jgi:hypothetical protein